MMFTFKIIGFIFLNILFPSLQLPLYIQQFVHEGIQILWQIVDGGSVMSKIKDMSVIYSGDIH